MVNRAMMSRIVLTAGLLLGCVAGCQYTSGELPMIDARRSIFVPVADTYYVLEPGDIYQNKDPGNPGPASTEMERAWDMANEFVYRTSLRDRFLLPAYRAGPDDVGYLMSFKRISKGDDLQ